MNFKEINKKVYADRLFDRLYTEFPSEVEVCCGDLSIPLDVLISKEKSQTSTNRYFSQSTQRTSLILKLASHLSESIPLSPSLLKLYKTLNILPTPIPTQHTSVTIEYSSIFTRPSDMIQYNIDRARQKFNKSVEIIKRIDDIKAEEKKRTESVIRRNQERDKKMIEEFNRREAEKDKQRIDTIEYRNKILQKKRDIVNQLDKQFAEYGNQLKNRMQRLSSANQVKLKEIVQKQHEKMMQKIQSDYSKVSKNESQMKVQAKEIEKSIEELEDRIGKRLMSYEEQVKKRVSNARENNCKVQRIFSKSLTDYYRKSEEKLVKIIRKSLVGEEKRYKKQESFNKHASDVRESVDKGFMRNSKGLAGLDEEQKKRIMSIESREKQKNKVFNDLRNKFQEAIREKKKKNEFRFENHETQYLREMETKARFRMKIIDKHQRISNLAETLKTQKFEISTKKRVDNFEIQKFRNSLSSTIRNRFDSHSRFETVMSNF